MPNHKAIDTSQDAHGIWISPTPHLVQGQVKQWAKEANVEPERIPGYWYHHSDSETVQIASPAESEEKTILYFHGGAYIVDTAHPSGFCMPAIKGLLQHSTTFRRVLSVEYRLSSKAPYPVANPFPAAVLDGIAAYDYLIRDLGFSPQNIIIQGDSGGGHLANMLVRYIVENPDILPLPGGVILMYPWADTSESHNIPTGSAITAAGTDGLMPLYGGFMGYAHDAFMGPHDLDRNPFMSPACKDLDSPVSFKGYPPVFLSVGGAERLLDQVRLLRDRMIKDMGEDRVCYVEPADAIHGFIGLEWVEPERTDVLKQIARWVEERV